jgi:hypothetical protein
VTLGPDDTLAVDAFVRNAGTDDVYVFGVLDWGFHGGLTLQVRNASGEPVEIPGGDHAPILAPSLARDRTRYVRLAPGHFLGCTRSLPAGALLGAPGQYTVRVVYFAPIIEEWCPRRPCWSMDGGPVASPWIPVEVRGATESR